MSAGRGAAARILVRACQWARVLEMSTRHGVRARATAKWHPSAHTSHHGHHASTGIMPARASCQHGHHASTGITPARASCQHGHHASTGIMSIVLRQIRIRLPWHPSRPVLLARPVGRRAGSPHPQTKRLRRGVGWRECARTHAHLCVSARALTRACDADGDSSLWQPGKPWCGRGHGMSVRASSHARALACACVCVRACNSQQCRLRAAEGAWCGRRSPTRRTCAGLTAPDRPTRTGTGARRSARANLPTARPSCSDVRAACAPLPGAPCPLPAAG
jgi:hypothetical protein